MTDADRDLEDRLRETLRSDADSYPVRVSGATLRARADHGSIDPFSMRRRGAMAAVVALIAVVGVLGAMVVGRLPAAQGTPSPRAALVSPSAQPTSTGVPSPTGRPSPSPIALADRCPTDPPSSVVPQPTATHEFDGEYYGPAQWCEGGGTGWGPVAGAQFSPDGRSLYVMFWGGDCFYVDHAVVTASGSALSVDLGIVRVEHPSGVPCEASLLYEYVVIGLTVRVDPNNPPTLLDASDGSEITTSPWEGPVPSPSQSLPPRASIAPAGSAVVARFRVNGGTTLLDVGTVQRDGTFATVASITDPDTLSALGNGSGVRAVVSDDGFAAVDGSSVAGKPTIWVYDLSGAADPPLRMPVVLDGEGRDMAWGPTNELVFSTDHSLVIYDPRTQVTTTIETGRRYFGIGWLPDGSGVVEIEQEGSQSSGGASDLELAVFLPDGSPKSVLTTSFPQVIWGLDTVRPYGANGQWLIQASGGNDGSGGSSGWDGEITRVMPPGGPWSPIWASDPHVTAGSGQWDAAGTGLWFKDDPNGVSGQAADRKASLIHYVAPEQPDRTVRFDATSNELGVATLAPDDSFALIGDDGLRWIDMVTGASHLINSPSDGQGAGPWQVAGWSADFPPYPATSAVGPGPTPTPAPSVSPSESPSAGRAPIAPAGSVVLVRWVGSNIEVMAMSATGSTTPLGTISDAARWFPQAVPADELGHGPVSESGYVAVDYYPVRGDAGREVAVFDLADPGRDPLVLDDYEYSAWGPDDDLAVVDYVSNRVAFVDLADWTPQHVPAIRPIDIFNSELWWLADGSGILIDAGKRPGDPNPFAIVRRDGTIRASVEEMPPLYPGSTNERPASSTMQVISSNPERFGQNILVDGKVWAGFDSIDTYPEWDATGRALIALTRTSGADSYDVVRSVASGDVQITFTTGDIPSHLTSPIFAPDDSFVVTATDDGGLVVIDLVGGTATVVPPGPDEQANVDDWLISGWGPGFPDYPVVP